MDLDVDPIWPDIMEAQLRVSEFPVGVLMKIFDYLPVESLLRCRETCSDWNNVILISELLDMKSCFVFDGRKDDAIATKCTNYMESCETKNSFWSHLKFRRMGIRQCSWIFNEIDNDPNFTFTISTLEFLNSTLNWATILQLMIECENLEVFIDKQDMYCWDYATFNSGIEEDETIIETTGYQQLRSQEKLKNLTKLKIVRIHRSQLVECTTYLKILYLKCKNLKELEISTDQCFAPQRGTLFYGHLAQLLIKTGEKLKILKFPYKLVCPTYDFRTTDEHRLFREFLTYIAENRWINILTLPVLETLSIQFGIIPVEGQDFNLKLAPFLQSLPQLKTFYLGCIQLENGMERLLSEFMNLCDHSLHIRFGVFMNDATGVPNILQIQTCLRSLSIQTFRDLAKEIKEVIPMIGIEEFKDLQELQYFSKNHTFKNFNLDLIIKSFSQLTHLNLVDHNARLETRHSCEALATIEDIDMQLLIKELTKLESLQLMCNMTFLTDSGLTGVRPEVCKNMIRMGVFTLMHEEKFGVPLSHLQALRSLVLRGLGIKVTDVTTMLAFNQMPSLRKLHLYGCHQVSSGARTFLSEKFHVTRGCDLQV